MIQILGGRYHVMQRVHADLGKNTNTVTGVNSDECPRARRVVNQVLGLLPHKVLLVISRLPQENIFLLRG